MIALKLTDSFDHDLELSLQPNFEDDSKKCVQLKLTTQDENNDWMETFFYFEDKAELNSYISWLVGMKKQLPE